MARTNLALADIHRLPSDPLSPAALKGLERRLAGEAAALGELAKRIDAKTTKSRLNSAVRRLEAAEKRIQATGGDDAGISAWLAKARAEPNGAYCGTRTEIFTHCGSYDSPAAYLDTLMVHVLRDLACDDDQGAVAKKLALRAIARARSSNKFDKDYGRRLARTIVGSRERPCPGNRHLSKDTKAKLKTLAAEAGRKAEKPKPDRSDAK